MSEDNTQAPVNEQEKPESAPDEGQAPEFFTEQFDVEKLPPEIRSQYDSMRADYTKKTQTVAEQRKQHDEDLRFLESLRSDPDVQLQALKELAQQHGYELDDEPEQPQEEDQDQPLYDPRVDELLAERDQQHQEAELDQLEKQIDGEIDAVGKQDGRDFTKAEKELLFSYTLALPPDGEGPDVKGAYELLKEAENDAVKRYVESKRAPQAPSSGQAGSPDIDLSDTDARRERMAAIMQEASD